MTFSTCIVTWSPELVDARFIIDREALTTNMKTMMSDFGVLLSLRFRRHGDRSHRRSISIQRNPYCYIDIIR